MEAMSQIRQQMQEGLRKALAKKHPDRVSLANLSTARWRAKLKPDGFPLLHKGRVVYRLCGLEFTQNPDSFATHILSTPTKDPA